MRRAALALLGNLPSVSAAHGLSRAAPAALRPQTRNQNSTSCKVHTIYQHKYAHEPTHELLRHGQQPSITTVGCDVTEKENANAVEPSLQPSPRCEKVQAAEDEQRLQETLRRVEEGNARVTIVRDARTASRAIRELTTAGRDRFIAWDTETTGIDPTAESPVGKGRILCMTAYGGEGLDFGNGPRLFVECMDGEGGEEILMLFRQYFENENLFKVWHNYSFDSHMLNNHGIKGASVSWTGYVMNSVAGSAFMLICATSCSC
jgi:3'-5' exonuclease